MNFEEFTEKVLASIKEYLQDEEGASIELVRKNNGLVLTGLVIRASEGTAVPTIYLEHFYDQYLEGDSFGNVMGDIIHIYEERTGIELDVGFFTNYEEMKKKIMFKVIHYERNILLLQEVPHLKWEDLAIVFYCILVHEQIGTGTIMIRNEHLQAWGITTQDLYKDAMRNTPIQLDEELIPMHAMLTKLGQEDSEEERELMDELDHTLPLYVLTNKWKMFGAGTILYSKKIKELSAKLGKDLYIIPSSVHELILIPCQENEDVQYMKEMIWEVNRTQVATDEVLSDALYYYDRGEDRIALMC